MSAGENYDKDLYSNSSIYRALRATFHLKTSLLNGFTTIRDVGNEGTGFADVDLSRCITKGFIDGPRLIPSGKGIANLGFYYPLTQNQNWEIDLPHGAQMVSGKDECIKAVRDQFSKGAKWIKVYLDWGTSNGIKTPSPTSIDRILIAITASGDVTVLSSTDIELLALSVEEKATLVKLLDRCMDPRGLRVAIGSESEVQEMETCSLVTCTYGCKGEVLGALGVIGPRRMNYSKVIPLVDYTAKLLTEILTAPRLAPEDVERVRDELGSFIDAGQQQPRRVSEALLFRTLAPDHPLAKPIYGTQPRSPTSSGMRSRHWRHGCSPRAI
jgi:hypothetical protein